jgi:UDP-N-acetylglucosamine kinase
LTPDEARISAEALQYAKTNKKRIARELTDTVTHPPEVEPVSVFMAGSPGAGKTEASLELLADFEGDGTSVLRIDPDDLRHLLPGYTGANSWLFQGGVSILVEKILDFAFAQDQSFLLDGTLSNYERAERNIIRSLKNDRKVQILYVYLDPLHAWRFVQAREQLEGRNIPPETFIDQYYAARDVVNRLKQRFGPAVSVDLLKKPLDGSERIYRAGIDAIDNHIPENYDRETLARLLTV